MPTVPPLSADPARCPSCGTPLPAQAPQGLCPQCLFAGLAGATDDGADAAPPAPVPVPEELAPHFPQLEILDCLGRGGMGVVYRARQKSLDRIVALKLLAPERVGDPAFAERFAREAQALAKLNHPHIVTIHDFGEAGGFFYLLMEYVDGVNLRQAMRAGRFTPEQALAIVPPVCAALQYAHEQGIVHRDIKPENLLLDRAGRVMIADFGLAKMLGAEGAAGLAQSQPAGTPQYMAPEQQDRRPADHRADIYSLGVVFYEMLTGELPARPLEVPSRKVQLDVRIDEIVLRALERTPELRYQTAGEFRTQVETLASGAAVPPLPPGAGLAARQTEAGGVERPPRFSRLAIIGAAWVPLFPLAFALYIFLHTAHPVPPGEPIRSGPGPEFWLLMVPMLVGFAAPLGTTILGWVAFVQIRRSPGRLRGKGLALFDGLFFPALAVLAALIYLLLFLPQKKAAAQRHAAHQAELQEAHTRSWIRTHRAGQCVTVSHGDAVQFVLYSPEYFGHSEGSGTGAGDGSWHEQVNISLLRLGRGFAVSRSSAAPENVTINGSTIRLDFGRAFALGADGRIEQVEFFPSASEARNGDEMAAKIEKIRQEGGARLIALGDSSEGVAQASNPRPKPAVLQFTVMFKRLVAQGVSLLFLLGFLYLVYRVWRRYGWWASLLLVLAGIAVLSMSAVITSREDSKIHPTVIRMQKAELQALPSEETDRRPAAP